jgi:hypothetical protein
MPMNVPVKRMARVSAQSTNRISSLATPGSANTNSHGALLVAGPGKAGIAADSNSVTLSWSGFLTNSAVAVMASGDLKHWTNASAPVPGPLFSLTNYAPALNYRLRMATNQIDLGKGPFYDSLYVSASAGGNTAIITHDFDHVHLTLYRHDKSLTRYTINEMIPQNCLYGVNYAWADNNRIVLSYVYTNRLCVDEYALTPTTVSRVSQIITGDAQSLTPDVLTVSDGTVIVCSPSQCGGMEAQMLHRKPTGQWFDDGKQQFIVCGPSEPAGYLKLYETPWNHHPAIAGVHDSWGILRVIEFQYVGIGQSIQVVTNFTLASNQIDCPPGPSLFKTFVTRKVLTSDGFKDEVFTMNPPITKGARLQSTCHYVDGLAAVHGEISPLQAVGDPVGNKVVFVYGNEQRSYFYGTGDGDVSMTQVAVVAMQPTATNYGKSVLFTCPGPVERVAEVQVVNMSNAVPIVTYMPMTFAYLSNWPPVSVASRVINGQEVSQEMYLGGWNLLYQHRTYRDLIGIRDDSHIVIVLEP